MIKKVGTMNEWQVKVEKLIVKIEKDVEYLVKRPEPYCRENAEKIKSNRWAIGIFFTTTLTLLIGILIK